MTLKVNDTDQFNLSMELIIHWDIEDIQIMVKFWNKTTHKIEKKFFRANDFSDAIKYYNRIEKFFF